MRWAPTLCAALLLLGCNKPKPPEVPRMPWVFEARVPQGEFRVLPVLAMAELPPPNLESFVGAPLPENRTRLRRLRHYELSQLPAAIGDALPGSLNGSLGERWDGEFRAHSWPTGAARERLMSALGSGRNPDPLLADIASSAGGQGVLVTWVDRLSFDPLTRHGFPGTLMETETGPVVLDDADEPHSVLASVGMALVTADGEVVLRYHDTYDTLLANARPPARAGVDVANALAADILKVWMLEETYQAPKSQ